MKLILESIKYFVTQAVLFTLFFLPSVSMSSNYQNQQVHDAIVDAAINENTVLLDKIITENDNLNALNNQGTTAAWTLTKLENLKALELVIALGIDVNAFDETLKSRANIINQTAFLYAGAKGLDEFLPSLISAGSDTTILNYYGGTALIPAAEKGYVTTVKLLLETSSVDFNHVNYLGWTALMEAVILSKKSSAQEEIITLLLDYGADKNIADKNDVSVTEHAQQKNLINVLSILERY